MTTPEERQSDMLVDELRLRYALSGRLCLAKAADELERLRAELAEAQKDKVEQARHCQELTAQLIEAQKHLKPVLLNQRYLKALWLIGQGVEYGLRIADCSNGLLRRGSVYLVLSELEGFGLITGHEEPAPEGQIGRRKYTITEAGKIALETQSRLDAAGK